MNIEEYEEMKVVIEFFCEVYCLHFQSLKDEVRSSLWVLFIENRETFKAKQSQMRSLIEETAGDKDQIFKILEESGELNRFFTRVQSEMKRNKK